MKALRFTQTGDLQHLKLEQVPIPKCGEGEVLVRVKAAAINPSDVKNVLGLFKHTTLPRIPGRDFAGVVVEGPEHLKGKEVWATGGDKGFQSDGSNAEFIAVSVGQIREKPSSLSFSQAAASGVGFLTAYHGLIDIAKLKEGERVLVIGARGAVGSAVAQIAKWKKATVIGVVRPSRSSNADDVPFIDKLVTFDSSNINNNNNALKELVDAVTDGKGVDVVFDTVSGDLMVQQGLECLGVRGRYLSISVPASSSQVSFNLLSFYRRELQLLGVNSLLLSGEQSAAILDQLSEGFQSGSLVAPQLQEISLEKYSDAYQLVHKGAGNKVILTL